VIAVGKSGEIIDLYFWSDQKLRNLKQASTANFDLTQPRQIQGQNL